MKVKIKKLHPDAVIPKYAKEGDAGMDLISISKSSEYLYEEYGTGLALEIPDGYVGFIFPRSSISKTRDRLCNSVAVIDSKFRGEIKLRFEGTFEDLAYKVGDRIAQLIIMPYPKIEFEEADELSETDRGSGGFGSSGQ